MPERNDCKHHDSPCANGRLQHLASLSEATLPVVLLTSTSKHDASLQAVSWNHSPGSPQRSLHGNAEEHKLPLLSPQQQSDSPRCQISQLVHSSHTTAQEPLTPGFGGESEGEGKQRLAQLEQKFKERGELLKAAVDALKAEIARRKDLEAELEDWRMKGRMMPELLKAMTSLETLIGSASGTLWENTSPRKSSSLTDTPSGRGDERRKRPKI